MRVLITGATGFIGAHLTRLLVRDGISVYALIRESSSTWRIEDVLQSVHVIHGDLLDFNGVEGQLKGARPETCFHLAWHAVPGEYLAGEQNLSMLSASIRLASSLAKLQCRKFVATGSCLEYDTDLGYLSETSPTKPRSLYAASKLSLFQVLTQFAAGVGMDFLWPRLFYQYGPYEDQRRLVAYIVSSLLRNQVANITKGEQMRDFLHVEDVASAIWASAQSDLTGPVNIGSGKPIAVAEIAAKIGEMLGRSELIGLGVSPIDPKEPMFVCANNNRLRDKTRWAPRYDMEGGLRQTIDWWKSYLGV